ncbi:MAG: DODA-type extradiol aromatic ring-opening family dioxygenase [Acidiferrobacteraceae bacterium]
MRNPDAQPQDTLRPTLFISHGAPTSVNGATAKCWRALSAKLVRPEAIVVVSAHWIEDRVTVGHCPRPETIHDFSGFPDSLYRLNYPAPGAPGMADRVQALLAKAGLEPQSDDQRGLDHGVWVPLMNLFPRADIPVVPVSLSARGGPHLHVSLGRALAPLRAENILIVTSGGLTHNLGTLIPGEEASPPEWVTTFQGWMHRALVEKRLDDLIDYRMRAPHAVQSHPSEEHLLPLFVAAGAAGEAAIADQVCRGYAYGTLAMDAYSFS